MNTLLPLILAILGALTLWAGINCIIVSRSAKRRKQAREQYQENLQAYRARRLRFESQLREEMEKPRLSKKRRTELEHSLDRLRERNFADVVMYHKFAPTVLGGGWEFKSHPNPSVENESGVFIFHARRTRDFHISKAKASIIDKK